MKFWWLIFLVLFFGACSSPASAPQNPDLPRDIAAEPDLQTSEPDLPPSCACRGGPCCDGCDLLPTSTLCASDVMQERKCDEESPLCGRSVLSRSQDQFCSGESAACEGEFVWNEWSPDELCTPDQACDPENLACAAVEACDQACIEDEGCLPEQHCGEDRVCQRDLCVQGEPYCEDQRRLLCDARGASSSLLETCEAQCSPEACLDCPSTFCQREGVEGLFCQGPAQVRCELQGGCLAEVDRLECADPTPLCEEGRCFGCHIDADCPTRSQTCQRQLCQCDPVCEEGSQGCNGFFQKWDCVTDDWGCTRRRVVPCGEGRTCRGGFCACDANFCVDEGLTEGEHCDGARRVRCGEGDSCVVEVFSQDCPCSCTDGRCDPCDDTNTPYIELGTGGIRFLPLGSGDILEVEAGIQGGVHVLGAVRAYRIADPNLVSLEFYVLEGDERLTTWTQRATLRPFEGGHEWFAVTVMFPLSTDPVSLDAREVTLVLELRTRQNQVYTDARDVTLSWR